MSVRPGPPIDEQLALRGCDAGFLYMETADQPTAMGTVAILSPRTDGHGNGQGSGLLTMDLLRAHVERRLADLLIFRWRLVRAPLGLYRPFLVDDPAFDLDWHLRHETLPAPGGAAGLDHLVARTPSAASTAPTRSGTSTLVDGLADDSQALILASHHGLIDGASA